MVLQNTDHVMKCDLGVWYSDDKMTGFKVLERDEKSTSIKIIFGSGETPSHELDSMVIEKVSKSTCNDDKPNNEPYIQSDSEANQ